MPSPVRAETNTASGSSPRSTRRSLGVDEVGLVEHDDLGHVAGAHLADDVAHGGDLAGGVGVRGVDDVHDQVGVADLLERRPERLDQLVRQVAHESDGVGERVHPAVGVVLRRTVGVEGREQRVLDEHAGAA